MSEVANKWIADTESSDTLEKLQKRRNWHCRT
jgi:hypothetical protein